MNGAAVRALLAAALLAVCLADVNTFEEGTCLLNVALLLLYSAFPPCYVRMLDVSTIL
jgi:hypothetical protein